MKFIIQHKEYLLIILILVISLPPRLWNLTIYPPVIVDESAYLRDIKILLEKPGFHPFMFQWDWSQSTLVYYPIIIIKKYFGIVNELLALRIISVIFSVFALIPFYFIIKNRTNCMIASCMTLLFSSSYYYLQFSRVGWGVIYSMTFALFSFWCLEKAIEKNSKILLIISGLFMGLIMYSYRGGQIYIIANIVFLLIKYFYSRLPTLKKLLHLMIFLISFFVITFPWINTINNDLHHYNLRLNVVSVRNTILPYHGLTNFQSIWQYQILTTAKSWILLEAFDSKGIENRRYLPLKDPPVNILIKFLFLTGLIVTIISYKRNWILLFILFLGLVLGQIMTVDPPNGARGLSILPIIYIISSLSLYRFYLFFNKNVAIAIVIILISLFFTYQDLIYYFGWMQWIKV